MLKIYCIHPIAGLSATKVLGYYKKLQKTLKKIGYDVFTPMICKGFLKKEIYHSIFVIKMKKV